MPYHDDDPFSPDFTLQDAVAVKLRRFILDTHLRYPKRRWEELPPRQRDYWRQRALELLTLIFAKANPPD